MTKNTGNLRLPCMYQTRRAPHLFKRKIQILGECVVWEPANNSSELQLNHYMSRFVSKR